MPLTKPPEFSQVQQHSKYADADSETRREIQHQWLNDVEKYVAEKDSPETAANLRGQLYQKYNMDRDAGAGYVALEAGKEVLQTPGKIARGLGDLLTQGFTGTEKMGSAEVRMQQSGQPRSQAAEKDTAAAAEKTTETEVEPQEQQALPDAIMASLSGFAQNLSEAPKAALWGWSQGATQASQMMPAAYKAIGDYMEWIGYENAGPAVQQFGEELYKQGVENIEYARQKSGAPTGSLLENPAMLTDPSFWSREISSAMATMTPAMITGGGGSIGRMAVVGGSMEAAPEFMQMREEGVDPLPAFMRSAAVGASVGMLEKVGYGKIFKGMSGKKLYRAVNASLGEAATEYTEEPTQAFLTSLGRRGVSLTDTGAEVMRALKEGVNVIPGAMGAGGAISVAREAGSPEKQLVGRETRMPDGGKAVVDQVAPGEGVYLRRKNEQGETENKREFVPIDQMDQLGKLYDTRGTSLEKLEEAEQQLKQQLRQAEEKYVGKRIQAGEEGPAGTVESVTPLDANEAPGVAVKFDDGSTQKFHPRVVGQWVQQAEKETVTQPEDVEQGELADLRQKSGQADQQEYIEQRRQQFRQNLEENQTASVGETTIDIRQDDQGNYETAVSLGGNEVITETFDSFEDARDKALAEFDSLIQGKTEGESAERSKSSEPEEVTPAEADNAKLDEQEFPVQQADPENIKVAPNRFQFKSDTDEFGVTQKQPSGAAEETEGPLQGKWDEKAAGNLIVWQDKQGNDYIVHGHHRLDLAKRSNVSQVNIQRLKESEGWTEADARAEGALLNIKAGQGKVKDYADFFRQHEFTEERARSEGLLGRDKGRRGFVIGSFATDNTYSAWKSGKISATKAEAIADVGRDSADLQDVGLKLARQQKLTAPQLRESLRLMKMDVQQADDQAGQLDLFGQNDAAMQEIAAEGKAASEIQKELRQDRSTLTQAIKKDEALEITKQKAQELGIQDRADQDEIQEARQRIDQQLEKWDTWSTSPELRRQARERAGLPVEQQTPAETQTQPAAEEEAQAEKQPWEITKQEYQRQIEETGQTDIQRRYLFHESDREELSEIRPGKQGKVFLSPDRPVSGGRGWYYAIDKSRLDPDKLEETQGATPTYTYAGTIPSDAIINLGKEPEYALTHGEGMPRLFVEAALRQGKSVPQEVLNDYPDLQQGQQAGTQQPGQEAQQQSGQGVTQSEVAPIVQRQENARERFLEAVQEQFNTTREEAEQVLTWFQDNNAVKLDAVDGAFRLQDGRVWEQSVINGILGREQQSEAQPAPAPASEARRPEGQEPGVSPEGGVTILQSGQVTNQDSLPPVPEGATRLFRGESPTVSFEDIFSAEGLARHGLARPEQGYKAFTSVFEYADYFRESYNLNRDATISYIDIPSEQAEQYRVRGSEAEYLLPENTPTAISPQTQGQPDQQQETPAQPQQTETPEATFRRQLKELLRPHIGEGAWPDIENSLDNSTSIGWLTTNAHNAIEDYQLPDYLNEEIWRLEEQARTQLPEDFVDQFNLEEPGDITVSQAERYVTEGTIPRDQVEEFVRWLENNAGEYVQNNVRRRFQESGLLETQTQGQSMQTPEEAGQDLENLVRGTKDAMDKDTFETYAQNVADTEQLPDYVRALARRLLKQSQEGATNYEIMRGQIIDALNTETVRGQRNYAGSEQQGDLFPEYRKEGPSLFDQRSMSETGPGTRQRSGLSGETQQTPVPEQPQQDVSEEVETRAGRQAMKKLQKDIGGNKPQVGIRSIVEFMTNLAHTRILTGKTQTTRRSPAHYRPREHVIRSRVMDFIGNFHEAGHAISGWLSENNIRQPGDIGDKLIVLTTMPGSYASAETIEEGMAEFVRRYITEPQTLPRSLRRDMENWLQNKDSETMQGLRDARRLWRTHRDRPLSEQLKANQRDTAPPPKLRDVFADTAYDFLGSTIGVSPVLHAINRRFWRALSDNRAAFGIPRSILSRTFRRHQNYARNVFNQIKDTFNDYTNAFQNLQHIPQEVAQAIGGTSKGLREGIRLRATDKSFDNLDPAELAKLRRHFDLPTEKQTHGNWVYLTETSYAGIREKIGAERWPDFEIYAKYRAALERYRKKQQEYPGRREGADPESVAQMIENMEADNPDFTLRFNELHEWMHQLLLPPVLSGELSVDEAIRIRGSWEDYMPLPRQMDPPGQGKGGGPEPDSGIRGAFGSYRNFKHLDDAVHERVRKAYESYYTDRAIKALRNTINQIGQDENLDFDTRNSIQQLMIPVKFDQQPVANISEVEQKQIIAEAINEMRRQELARVQQQEEGEAALDPTVSDQMQNQEEVSPTDINLQLPGRPLFRATKPKGIKVVSTFENGGRQYYQVTDPLMFKLFAQSSDPNQYMRVVTDALRDIGRPWKRVITQNLAFALRNTIARDPMTAVILSEDVKGIIPGYYVGVGAMNRAMSQSGKGGVDMREVRTAAELLSQTLDQMQSDQHQGITQRFKDILKEGIVLPEYGQMSGAEKLAKAPGQIMSTALKPIELFLWATGQRRISQLGEELAREGAFIRARQRGYSQEEAQRNYDRVTGDFGKRGLSQNAVGFIRAAQFLNPGLQIMWQQAEQVTHPDPKVRAKFLAAKLPALVTYGGIAAAVNHLLMGQVYDDDEREELRNAMRERPDKDRTGYMTVMGKVRLPFDYGVSGSAVSLGWNMVEGKLLEDPVEGDVMAKRLLARARDLPGFTDMIAPHLKTVMELNIGDTGYSFFWEDDIMPQWMLEAFPHDPSARAFNDTPEVYKKLGQGLNVSPIKIRYGVRQMFTRVMDDTIEITDKAAAGRPIRPQDVPIVGNLVQRKPRGWYSNSVRTVSELNDQYRAAKRRLDRMKEHGQEMPNELLRRENELKLAHKYYLKVERLWRQAKKARDQRNPDWDTVQFYEEQMTDVAREYVQMQQNRDRERQEAD